MSLSKNINPSLVLVQPRKTRPFITERLLMGPKESNQTNKRGFTVLLLQMGYGSRAMELLQKYYEGKIQNLSEAEEEEMSNVKDEVSTSSGSRGGFMAPPSPGPDPGFLERGFICIKGRPNYFIYIGY